tara:strand:- start:9900 stop:10313 length:414 start_codon:yes stop_codon:yes gene_type:complete
LVDAESALWHTVTLQEPDMKFTPGQSWRIKDIDQEGARAVIGRIEPAAQLDGKIVVHCTLFNVAIVDMGEGPEALVFGHIPFTLSAFSASADGLIEAAAQTAAAFDEGYYQWAEALGGAFDVPIAQAVGDALQAARD